MGNPPLQTGGGPERRATPQSPLPNSKAPGSEKNLVRDPASLAAAAARTESSLAARADSNAADDDEEYEDDDGNEADWGLKERKPKMAKQTILGLSVIVILLGLFGVLIFKKVQERKALAQKALSSPNADDKSKTDAEGDAQTEPGKGKILLAAGKNESKESKDLFDSSLDPSEPSSKGKPAGKHSADSKHAAKSSHKPPEDQDLDDLEKLGTDPKVATEKPGRGTSSSDGLDFGEAPVKQPAGRTNLPHGDGKPAQGNSLAGSAKPSTTGDMLTELPDDSEIPVPQPKTAAKESREPSTFGKNDDLAKGGHRPASKKPVAATDSADPFGSEPDVELKSQPKLPPAKSNLPPVAAIGGPKAHDHSLPHQPQPKLSAPADEFEDVPVAKAGRPVATPRSTETSPSSEKLGAFEVANDPLPKKIPIEPAAPIKPVPAATETDPRLYGFEVVEEDSTRAVSKTIVQRPPEVLHSTSGSGVTEISGKQPGVVPTPTDDEEPLSVSPRRTTVTSPSPKPVAVRTTAPVAESSRNPSIESYTIAPNDNFWTISRKQYGTARYFQALLQHNKEKIGDASRMRPGTVISTPSREVLEQKYPQLIDKTPAAPQPAAPRTSFTTGSRTPTFGSGRALSSIDSNDPPGVADAGGYFDGPGGQPMYRVGQGDTLADISQRHLGRASRWFEIFERNKDAISNPNALKIGTVIRLPADASRVGFVSDGAPRR